MFNIPNFGGTEAGKKKNKRMKSRAPLKSHTRCKNGSRQNRERYKITPEL